MIELSMVRLINWYAFNNITAPFGKFTLVAGRNGNGKSVLLDAIKYALYGDTVFNKSTENKGSRTVTSYTRGLLDATAGSYMRPVDKVPNVYTHIVLEMHEKELDRYFILGTVIETNSGNGFVTKRYVIEGKRLSELELTYLMRCLKQKGVDTDTIITAPDDYDASIYSISKYIEQHCGEPLRVHELAQMCGMSYSYFAKLFRETYNQSCKEYIEFTRINKAADLLLFTNQDLTYISQETGFADCSHLIRTFKKWKGMTPKQWKKSLK